MELKRLALVFGIALAMVFGSVAALSWTPQSAPRNQTMEKAQLVIARDPASGLIAPSGGLGGATSSGTSPQYPETFTEVGLPSGVHWNVTLNGQTLSAVTPSSIVFLEPNGTYGYTIGGVFGWQLVRPSMTGTVHVAGAPNTVVVPSIGVGGDPMESPSIRRTGICMWRIPVRIT
jgi:hypothetical protein